MNWNPICECGNQLPIGKAQCTACRKAKKALKKGNLERYGNICAVNPGIGELYEGKPYRRVGDMLIEIV